MTYIDRTHSFVNDKLAEKCTISALDGRYTQYNALIQADGRKPSQDNGKSRNNRARKHDHKLTNTLINDKRVGYSGLVLAYVKAFRGDEFERGGMVTPYALNITKARTEFGIGARGFRDGINELQAGQYYQRSQPVKNGRIKQFAVDSLIADCSGNYLIANNETIKTLEELKNPKLGAVYIYMLGQARGFVVTAHDVAERFGTNDRTAKGHLDKLSKRDLITAFGKGWNGFYGYSAHGTVENHTTKNGATVENGTAENVTPATVEITQPDVWTLGCGFNLHRLYSS